MSGNFIALTRPGYEIEFAREFRGKVIKGVRGSGVVSVESDADGERKPWKALDPTVFIFARQFFMVFDEVEDAPPEELAVSIGRAALAWRKTLRQATGFHSLMMEAADTEEGRVLLARHQGLEEAVAERLTDFGLVPKRRSGLPRLHIFLDPSGKVLLGLSDPVLGTPWPMGAARIELPSEAPSRSARKLEEAIRVFIPAHELEGRLDAGMRAVDLGASPGGWSWLLSRRGLIVEAVDNGPLDKEVMEFGLVTHVTADGYSYRPQKPVDWLFCDIVGAAPRIARLVANWVKRVMAKEMIFNLKLGEGDRFRQLEEAKKLIFGVARTAGVRIELRLKHLYHDRDEVTGHLVIVAREKVNPAERVPAEVRGKGKSPSPGPRAAGGVEKRGKKVAESGKPVARGPKKTRVGAPKGPKGSRTEVRGGKGDARRGEKPKARPEAGRGSPGKGKTGPGTGKKAIRSAPARKGRKAKAAGRP